MFFQFFFLFYYKLSQLYSEIKLKWIKKCLHVSLRWFFSLCMCLELDGNRTNCDVVMFNRREQRAAWRWLLLVEQQRCSWSADLQEQLQLGQLMVSIQVAGSYHVTTLHSLVRWHQITAWNTPLKVVFFLFFFLHFILLTFDFKDFRGPSVCDANHPK